MEGHTHCASPVGALWGPLCSHVAVVFAESPMRRCPLPTPASLLEASRDVRLVSGQCWHLGGGSVTVGRWLGLWAALRVWSQTSTMCVHNSDVGRAVQGITPDHAVHYQWDLLWESTGELSPGVCFAHVPMAAGMWRGSMGGLLKCKLVHAKSILCCCVYSISAFGGSPIPCGDCFLTLGL